MADITFFFSFFFLLFTEHNAENMHGFSPSVHIAFVSELQHLFRLFPTKDRASVAAGGRPASFSFFERFAFIVADPS